MKTSITFTAYLKKKYASDKEGIINIRITENRKSKYVSIKEVIKERYWNANKNEVRSSYEDCERLMKLINDRIIELKSKYFELKNTITKIEKTSVVQFYDSYVKLLIQQGKIGTSKNTNTSFSRLKEYLKDLGKSDILFEDIDIHFVEQYEIFIRNKGISNNTTKKYVSILGRIYNLAIKKQVFIMTQNPFVTFENSKISVNKERLTKIELENIMQTEIEPGTTLYNTRNCFLFQVFGQGIRVSDLLTLRWGNIVEGRLDFFQFKTKKKLSIKLNYNLLLILKDLLPDRCNEIMNAKYKVHIEENLELTYFELQKKYKKFAKENLHEFIKNNKEVIEKIEARKKQLDKVKDNICLHLIIKITDFSNKNPNKFIFSLLNEDDFKNISFGADQVLSKFQYNQISSKTTIYNNQLKKLQALTQTSKTLTSHLARHTYTNLMIELTENDIYSISKSLGHQSLATTEHYLSDFNTERMDSSNEGMNELFN